MKRRIFAFMLVVAMLAMTLVACGSDTNNTTNTTNETEVNTEVEEEVVETPVVDAPQTFDAAIIAAVAAVVSLAGYAISKKR